MAEQKDKVSIGLRLASMLIDHFTMTFIVMILTIPVFAFSFVNAFNISHEPSGFNIGMMILFTVFGFSVYFNKDIFNGRSIAKRILRLQVMDEKTNRAASPLKCLIRNLTIAIWPIEIVFVLIDPKRRLGDRIAGTRIDYVEISEKAPIKWKEMLTPLLIAICFSVLLSLPFMILSNWVTPKKVEFIETSLNQGESEKINQLVETESNGLIKKADFRVYDKVTNDKRKYVAGILYFNNQTDFDNFHASESMITKLLETKLPLKSHIWFLKFVYRKSGSISTQEKLYDNRDKLH